MSILALLDRSGTDQVPKPPQEVTSPMTLEQELKAEARDLGFIACGITDPRPVPHAAELDDWLARGYAGTMRYLQRQAKRRKDPQRIVPEARSVVVICENYYYQQPDPQPVPKIAKYAFGTDYHIATSNRINKLADWLMTRGAKTARPYIDAGPVPERELAQRAGLGWIGKNTMLISPRAGSYFLIGAVFTDLALAPDDPFTEDHCGSCTRCLEACPTGAFVGPRVLDATRCISYLTIEHRGDVPETLADRFQGWGFGCDICNDVCPWNHKFSEESSREEFRTRPIWEAARSPDFFECMDPGEFTRQFGDTPMERPGLDGMRRNWRIAHQEEDETGTLGSHGG
jgi:epoxyqueuosine reductase